MRNVLLLFFALYFSEATAQNNRDSLIIVLASAMESGDSLGITRAYYKLGIAYDKQDNFEKSNYYLNRALFVAKKIKSSKAIAVITNYLACNYSEQGRQGDAIDLYEKSYKLFISLNDSAEAAAIYMNLGSEYLDMSEYEKALEYEIKALEMKEKIGDSLNIAHFYMSVGEIFKLLGVKDKWKEYLQKADELSGNSYYADFKTKVAILKHIAGLKEEEGDYDAALNLYESLYSISEKNGYVRGMNVAYTNMSSVFIVQNKYVEALDVAKKAYALAIEEKNVLVIVNRCNKIGSIYIAKNQGVDADKWFRLALKNAKGRYPDEILYSYKGIFNAGKLTGRYKSSVDYIEKYILIKDSIQNVSIKKRVTELETIYQTEKNKSRIKNLDHQNKIQNQQLRFHKLLLWAIVVIALFMIVVVFLVLRQQKLNSRNKEIMLQQKLLRSQMNPHFIFNSLGAIQNFMYQNENKKASFYLGSFSSLMRSILNHSREEMISLEEEIKTLNNYLELQKMRLGFMYEVSCSEHIDEEFTLIPPMLIQPFVENSIKHGVRDLAEKGMIKVNFSRKNNSLVITIEDNGIGINSTSSKNDTEYRSLALEIFKERISYLASYFKREIVYKIVDKSETNSGNNGTIVTIEGPLILE